MVSTLSTVSADTESASFVLVIKSRTTGKLCFEQEGYRSLSDAMNAAVTLCELEERIKGVKGFSIEVHPTV